MPKKEIFIQFVTGDDDPDKIFETISNFLWEWYGIDNVSFKTEELTEFARND